MSSNFSDRMKTAMNLKHIKQADIVEKTKIGKSSISQYLSGNYEPKQKNIYLIAKALDVNEAWLMGHDVPMERDISLDKKAILTSEQSNLNVINRIIARRKELGYSYQDLSNKTGLNKSALIRYENGDIKTLSLDSIEIIAKGLGVTPAFLMGWEESPKKEQSKQIDTIAAHLEDKNITPQKLKLLEKYIDALFDDED